MNMSNKAIERPNWNDLIPTAQGYDIKDRDQYEDDMERYATQLESQISELKEDIEHRGSTMEITTKLNGQLVSDLEKQVKSLNDAKELIQKLGIHIRESNFPLSDELQQKIKHLSE